MKNVTFILIMIFFATMTNAQKSLHDFTVTDIEGKTFNLSTLKGKKVLIVNTASKCGFTPQYEQLQKIYDTYGGNDFIIIGFPANNFNEQEPGTNKDIAQFCQRNYGVTFPMMSKISVKGNDMHPVYQWLTQKSKNGVLDSEVTWNFQKYLIDEEGHLVSMLEPKVKPDDEQIVSWLRN